jgi:WD40 repeat protein
MPLKVKCPHCQAPCSVASATASRNLRCPSCQSSFQPAPAATVGEAIVVAESAAPPLPPRSNDLIPPSRKRPRNELIPPPPDGPSVKKTPSFVEREVHGLVVILLVGGVGFIVMLGLIAALVAWGLFKASPPGPHPVETNSVSGLSPAAPTPREHGPPPAAEAWTVLDEQRLEHKQGIWNVAITADGKTLATTSNSFLRLWDLSAVPPVEKASMPMLGGRSTALHFSPDGRTLFLGVPGNELHLLDVTGPKITTRRVMKDWAGNVWSITHSPDGKTLAVGADDMTVWLYDVSGDQPKEKKVLRVQKTALGVKELLFTSDGNRIILGTGAGAVRLWDVAADELRELVSRDGESDTFLLPMALSPDGKVLAVARAKTVHLLEVTEDGFTEWMKLTKHKSALRAVNFSPDGKLLATTGTDGQIILWQVGLEKPMLVKQRAKTFCAVLFVPGQPDVRIVACNWNSGTIYLFKVGK